MGFWHELPARGRENTPRNIVSLLFFIVFTMVVAVFDDRESCARCGRNRITYGPSEISDIFDRGP